MAAVERLLAAGHRYTALGVQQICDEAGVARSAFYVNFGDKTDLLLRVVEAATVDIVWISDQWLSSQPTLGLEALVDAQEQAIGVFRAHAPLLSAYAEVAAYDDKVAAFWRTRLDTVIASAVQRVVDGQAAGDVRAELSPETAARFIVLGSERLMRDHVVVDAGPGDRRLAEEIGRAIWFMLHPG
jgi:AcrR family transcriptional regulator